MTAMNSHAEIRSAIVSGLGAFYATEASWCRYAAARDANGKPVETSAKTATRFCLMAGLWKVVGGLGLDPEVTSSPAKAVLNELQALTGQSSLLGWNDFHGRTFAELRELIGKLPA